jgi:prephenate dehydrogenase
METIAIVGVGLIGGSLGLALRAAGFNGSILGVSSDATIAAALKRGAIDKGVSLQTAAKSADVIYLAQPIHRILDTLTQLGDIVRSETLVTDAGSTKVEIVQKATHVLKGCHFLGGHPLAGKEARGVEAAEAGLFQGRTYVLTPRDSAELNTKRTQAFISWLRKCGTTIVVLSPEHHDKTVAYTSHLPQISSTALAAILAHLPDEQLRISGPGAIGMTRLAMSTFDIWRDILETNRDAVDHALSVYIDKLTEIRHNLQTQQLGEDFRVAADAAIRLRHVGVTTSESERGLTPCD